MAVRNIQDRISQDVLANGAVKYSTYTGEGAVAQDLYIQKNDNPSVEGTPINKSFITDTAILEFNHIKSGNVHQLTNETGVCANIRFKATSDFANGDTFTINGTPVTAYLSNGNSISSKIFKTGRTVLCFYDGNILTFPINDAMPKTGGTFSGPVKAVESKLSDRSLKNIECRQGSTSGTLEPVVYYISVVD